MAIQDPKLRSEVKIVRNTFARTIDFAGCCDVIETVEEVKVSWEKTVGGICCYIAYWFFDYKKLKVTHYTSSVSDDVIGIHPVPVIPRDLLRKMQGKALAFLEVEQVKRTLEEDIIFIPHDNPSMVTLKFRGRQWSGYMLIYEELKNGKLRLHDSRNMRYLAGDAARNGHPRVPKVLCKATYDLTLKRFQGNKPEPPKQSAFELSLPTSPGGDSCDD